MNNKSFLIISFCILVGVSCNKGPGVSNLNLGKEYYPIETGKAITYQVDSTIYDDFTGNTIKTKSYLRDVIDTSFLDLQNRTSHYVLRYHKSDTGKTFNFQKVYYITDAGNQIEVVEENLRFIKLVFPVTFLGSWLGNKYISSNNTAEEFSWYSDWQYQYNALGKPYSNDSLNFDNTLSVNQFNNVQGDTVVSNITKYGEQTYSMERYAKNVGLVYKNLIRWKKDPAIANGKRKGFALEMKAIGY